MRWRATCSSSLCLSSHVCVVLSFYSSHQLRIGGRWASTHNGAHACQWRAGTLLSNMTRGALIMDARSSWRGGTALIYTHRFPGIFMGSAKCHYTAGGEVMNCNKLWCRGVCVSVFVCVCVCARVCLASSLTHKPERCDKSLKIDDTLTTCRHLFKCKRYRLLLLCEKQSDCVEAENTEQGSLTALTLFFQCAHLKNHVRCKGKI